MSAHGHSHDHQEDDGLQSLSSSIQWFEQIFSKIGVILNLSHLLILTRKSMRTSSVNSIMIGIAICDFLSMCNVIRNEYMPINPMGSCCTPPSTLTRMNFDWFLTSFQNGLRRCSSWLAVLIALVRYLVITRMLNTKISSSGFGFLLTFLSFLFSSFFSVLFFSQFHFDVISSWHPDPTCPGYSSDFTVPVYGQLCNELFEVDEGLFHRIQLIVEGVIGKIVPCILLPILTGLLITKLKTTDQNITDVSMVFRHSRTNHKDRVTSIVIFIAVTYLVTEFPLGIVYIADATWHNDPVVGRVIKNVEIFCNTIFTANASLHCLICFLMSTPYRKTVWEVLSIFPFVKKQPKKMTTSLVSRNTH